MNDASSAEVPVRLLQRGATRQHVASEWLRSHQAEVRYPFAPDEPAGAPPPPSAGNAASASPPAGLHGLLPEGSYGRQLLWVAVGFLLTLLLYDLIRDRATEQAMAALQATAASALETGSDSALGSVSSLVGAELYSAKRRRIGRIDEVMFDPASKRFSYALVTIGSNKLGWGGKRIILPLSAVRLSISGDAYLRSPPPKRR